jgi:hypothetical protein
MFERNRRTEHIAHKEIYRVHFSSHKNITMAITRNRMKRTEHGRDKEHTQKFLSENQRGRNHLADIGLRGKIFLFLKVGWVRPKRGCLIMLAYYAFSR